ncbi:MAG: gamma-glutamyltransferase, partial [Candidatus Eiseniibacteriota bacterium]
MNHKDTKTRRRIGCALRALFLSFVPLCLCGFVLFLSAHALAQTAESARDPERSSGRQEKTEVVRYHHMVVAANPHAAEAGLAMLRAGGSAVDAAIAAELVLNLVEPQSSGIGGGAFMLTFDPKTKTTTSFDGRELAPASATPGMFLG